MATDPAINAMPGTNIGDGSWRSMLRATIGRMRGTIVLELLWGVEKCFEQVSPEFLWGGADSWGTPWCS